MPVELVVPSVGESITEVEIGDWLKREGDEVRRDEPVVVLESDKVNVELTAPADGKITSTLKAKGEKASIGDVIGYIEEGKVEKAATRLPSPGPSGHPLPEGEGKEAKPSPSGRGLGEGQREEQAVPMTPIRRRIAERLVEAQKNAALLTTFNQADMSHVIALRKQYQDSFQSRHGAKLGFMSFFVKASIEALKLVPQINAEVRGNDIVYRNYFDIGIAVGGSRGLVVPILRNAERMSFAEVEKGIAEFAERAQTNQLRVDELQGGTFTISNGGIYGSMLSTPIVNPPQSGILGLHAIEDRPIALNGAVVIRPMMYLALTYDHRIVDGREAVTFLKRVRDLIEDPSRILLEI